LNFVFWSFEFVSNFGFRYSDFNAVFCPLFPAPRPPTPALIALVIVITCGIMPPYRNITGGSPSNKTTGAICQRTFCITAITMNIERVKQFIKEVRWGFLATTDGRPQCLSVFLSVSVRVYEILRRYIEDESVDLVHLDRLSKATRIITSSSPSVTAARPPLKSRHSRIPDTAFICSPYFINFVTSHHPQPKELSRLYQNTYVYCPN